MTSSSHGHQVVPVSDVGAWAGGVVDWVGEAVGVALAVVLVCGLGETGGPVGLRVARWVVAVAVVVAVTVAVAVAVVVAVVVAMAGVLGAGCDADGVLVVGVLDAAAVDVSADGADVTGVLGASDRLGSRVGVGVSDLDVGRAVGSSTLGVSVTLGASDRVGVGSPAPFPPDPHPARTPTVMSAAAMTATRMVLPPARRRTSPAPHDKRGR